CHERTPGRQLSRGPARRGKVVQVNDPVLRPTEAVQQLSDLALRVLVVAAEEYVVLARDAARMDPTPGRDRGERFDYLGVWKGALDLHGEPVCVRNRQRG